ncbi:glycine--tRNA ligase subunit beta [Rhodobacteraceae bacterium DSL-40]|uniref:glycine--tRNA ligase subunit beta n=1 Tax=Amaricoccus sp. B4 TaxID=3368557 RepID=UPI000DAB7AEF
MPDLLLELFSEEIPARMQARASADLKRLVTEGVVSRGLTYAHAEAFATPRRLALALAGLADHAPTTREERKGPRVDAPEKAIEGFLRSTGLAREDLSVRDDKKGQVYFAEIVRPGRPAAEIVAEVVEEVVRTFPWPKSMRWGNGSLRWVRPLHSILCLLSSEAGAEAVPLKIDGIAAGKVTRGHRFMAPEPFAVQDFEDYRAKLDRAFVLLDPADRAEKILHDATQLAFAQGLELVEDKGLLAEVAGLVEWPVVLMGRIEERFLDLPPEVLRTSMKEHQKFLSVRDPKDGRIVAYVVVANRDTHDNGATILAGNARVLAARLSDAVFFWENDLRTPLAAMTEKLGHVTFHNKLGTQGEQIKRIAELARDLAPKLGTDPDLAERAALLAKADLASEMVYEFPELQGVMGRYYALRAGEDAGVAEAAAEHYSPLGPSDATPRAPLSVAVALADKIDRLTAFWAIDEKPTGSRDPFALRRAALGVIRLVLENGLRLRLSELLAQGYPGAEPEDLMSFFADRLAVHLRDQGVRHDVIRACFELGGQDDLVLLVARVEALQTFLGSEDGANLLAGYKRAVNILEQEERKDGVEYSLDPHVELAETEAERALFTALDDATRQLAPALAAEDFGAAMAGLAGLRAPIDAFFETTVVNSDKPLVRRNRLCLLNRIRKVMNQVAIFSVIEG